MPGAINNKQHGCCLNTRSRPSMPQSLVKSWGKSQEKYMISWQVSSPRQKEDPCRSRCYKPCTKCFRPLESSLCRVLMEQNIFPAVQEHWHVSERIFEKVYRDRNSAMWNQHKSQARISRKQTVHAKLCRTQQFYSNELDFKKNNI
jgi:hypothetical protein